jgi:hypothetical protein
VNAVRSTRTERRRRTEAKRARRDWLGIILRPHVLVGVVAVAAALPYLLGSFASQSVEVAVPPFGVGPAIATRPVDMPLVVFGTDGATRTTLVSVRAAEHEAARWRATLVALRDALVSEGVWPESVAAPGVVAFTARGRTVAVVDVRVAPGVATSVAQEWASLRSLVETLEAVGADEVQVIVNGAPSATLWGHVALP